MNRWENIKVGDLVRCAVMSNLGIGVVIEIRSFNSGQANAMCYWATPDKRFTYFLDQLVPVEDK